MNKWLLLLMLWISSVGAAFAQSSRVIDLAGNGVSEVRIDATVTCAQTAGPIASATVMVTTDTEGRFTWPTPGPPGIGSGCLQSVSYSYTLKKDGYIFTRTAFRFVPLTLAPRQTVDERIPLIQASNLPACAIVSAAGFITDQYLANEMIVAVFGTNLAASTQAAQLPLPTELVGRRVMIQDSAGLVKAAKLLFVAPGQINCITPAGLANGPAVIRVLDENNGVVRTGLAYLREIAPGVFSDNASGQGVASAVVVRVRPGNLQSYEPVSRFDTALQRFVPLELDLGPESEFLVLALFGTGWRQASGSSAVIVNIGNSTTGYVSCPVEYVGTQPTIEGLDQINVRLPRTLIGKGDVEVRVSINGISTNIVQLKIK